MEQFRNIGIIGRLGSTQVLDTVRRLKKFLLERHLHVILEDTIAEILPGHGLQTSSRKMLGEVCDMVIVVGGDGSLTTGMQLMKAGIPVVGVPKTIDNDLAATAMTFGFDSAVSTVVDGLDRLQTTADSHKRVMVVEVMGRSAGWIALWGGLAGGAHIILIPEIPFNFDSIKRAIEEREARGLHSTMVVVAEGATLPDGGLITKEDRSNAEHRLGGVGDFMARKIEELTGKETRACTLGHLQRGGSPTSLDRMLGARFGVKAVKLIEEGQFGHMVSYQSYSVGSVPINEAVEKVRRVEPDGEIVATARAVGISFGDD